jgi:hypothetical protein
VSLRFEFRVVMSAMFPLKRYSVRFYLYHGGQLYWWKKSLFPYKTTDLPQLKLSYLSSFNIGPILDAIVWYFKKGFG